MKTKNRIEIMESENEVEYIIRTKRVPAIVILIMGFVALIGFIMPPTVLILSFIFDLNLGFGFLFTILIGFGTGYYLTKLILWNTFGLERFLISNQKAEYYCDYKFFKSNRKVLENPLTVKYLTNNINSVNVNKENIFGRLIIESSDDKIESQINLPIRLLDDLLSVIKKDFKDPKDKIE
jgi:hypothetical protein